MDGEGAGLTVRADARQGEERHTRGGSRSRRDRGLRSTVGTGTLEEGWEGMGKLGVGWRQRRDERLGRQQRAIVWYDV